MVLRECCSLQQCCGTAGMLYVARRECCTWQCGNTCRDTVALWHRMYCGTAGMLYPTGILGHCVTECIMALRECSILQGYCGTVSPNVLWHCRECCILQGYCGTVSPNVLWHCGHALSCRDTSCGTVWVLWRRGDAVMCVGMLYSSAERPGTGKISCFSNRTIIPSTSTN